MLRLLRALKFLATRKANDHRHSTDKLVVGTVAYWLELRLPKLALIWFALTLLAI